MSHQTPNATHVCSNFRNSDSANSAKIIQSVRDAVNCTVDIPWQRRQLHLDICLCCATLWIQAKWRRFPNQAAKSNQNLSQAANSKWNLNLRLLLPVSVIQCLSASRSSSRLCQLAWDCAETLIYFVAGWINHALQSQEDRTIEEGELFSCSCIATD